MLTREPMTPEAPSLSTLCGCGWVFERHLETWNGARGGAPRRCSWGACQHQPSTALLRKCQKAVGRKCTRRQRSSVADMHAPTRLTSILVDRANSDRRTVIASCLGHGFKFAPVLGEILADIAEGKVPAFPSMDLPRTGHVGCPRFRIWLRLVDIYTAWGSRRWPPPCPCRQQVTISNGWERHEKQQLSAPLVARGCRGKLSFR